MQAIITKYIPPTNIEGGRIKAKCGRGAITVYYGFGTDENEHRDAAKALVEKFLHEDEVKYGSTRDENLWGQPFVTGCLPTGEYVHVFLPKGVS